jgi:hypothetical protein
MPRFVILLHVTPPESERGTHYDLMLEQDGKLLTWAIAEWPRAGLKLAATRLPDHRPSYLDYEGPISGNRGEVTRVDAGEYASSQLDDTAAKFVLHSSNGDLHVKLRHQSENQWIAEFSGT